MIHNLMKICFCISNGIKWKVWENVVLKELRERAISERLIYKKYKYETPKIIAWKSHTKFSWFTLHSEEQFDACVPKKSHDKVFIYYTTVNRLLPFCNHSTNHGQSIHFLLFFFYYYSGQGSTLECYCFDGQFQFSFFFIRRLLFLI